MYGCSLILPTYLPLVLLTVSLIQEAFLLTSPGRCHLHFYGFTPLMIILFPSKVCTIFYTSVHPDVCSPSLSFKINFRAPPVVDHVSLNPYSSRYLYFCNVSTSFRLIWIFTTLLCICTERLSHGEWTLLCDMDCVTDIFIFHIIKSLYKYSKYFPPNPFSMWPLNLIARLCKWENTSKWGKQSEALLESSSNIVMPLSLFSPLGHEIIGTFELARILDDIKPNTLILEMSMWLVLIWGHTVISRVGTEKSHR